jgi:hypothetical protein
MLLPNAETPQVFVQQLEDEPLLYEPTPHNNIVAQPMCQDHVVAHEHACGYSVTVQSVKNGVGVCCNLPADVLIMITAVVFGFLGLLFGFDWLILGAIIIVSFNVCGCVKTSIVTSIPSIFVCAILALALVWRDLPRIFRVYILHQSSHTHTHNATTVA